MSGIKAIDKLRTAARNMAKGRNLENHEECNLLIIIADEIEAEAAEMKAFCERVEKAAKAREELEVFGTAYMPLPLDADGVPIKVGDTVYNKYFIKGTNEYTVRGFRFDQEYGQWNVQVGDAFWISQGLLSHVKPRTLEDVLFEFGEEFEGEMDEIAPIIAKYAEEIRELMGGAE